MASGNGWVARALDSYERPLIRYAHRMVGELESARDVVQDCFLRLCRQPKGRAVGSLIPLRWRACYARAR